MTAAAQEVVVRPEPWNRIDPQDHPWLHWLESRTHFRNEHGSVVVGHEALVAAVNAVGSMIEENEQLRAENAELRQRLE